MWISGVHAVKAYLENRPDLLKVVYLQRAKSRLDSIAALAEASGIQVVTCEGDLSQDKRLVQGVGAECTGSNPFGEEDIPSLLTENGMVLVLDCVQDPHNFGACLRTADAIGVDCVIVPKDKSAPLNDTVAKVASGALATVPVVRVTNLARALKQLKELNVWLYGTAMEGDAMYTQVDYSRGRVGLVMGSEGKGMRRLTREACDQLIKIPMQGYVESLNVSVATAVCLYEIRRQKSNV